MNSFFSVQYFKSVISSYRFPVGPSEIFLAIIVFLLIDSYKKREKHGLPSFPLVGMLPSLLIALQSNTYEWITSVLKRKNGTFVFVGPRFTSLNCVVTSDPCNVEHLLKTKFTNFPKGEYFRNIARDLLGDGIFNVDDEAWRQQRKAASLEFHSADFRKHSAASIVKIVHSRLLPVLEEAASDHSRIDLQDVLLRLTFDNVCMLAFGSDPGCLGLGLPEIPFAKAFEEATEITTLRFVTPTSIWITMRYLNIGYERKLKRCLQKVDEFANDVIALRKKELGLESHNQRSDLLSVFMRMKDDDGKQFTDKFLRDVCVNFILAGRDTSSVALAWFFWLLHQNPAVEEKILEEIHYILHQRGECSEKYPLVFTPEEVKRMNYLHAALSEALRLYPSVPVDHKQVTEDEEFPDGTKLKKGTKVIYAIFAMGRMESLWGSDCREFKPERWLKDGKLMTESSYKFSAFNGGPRLCLGKDFAYYQMKFVAASIIYRYKVNVVENHPVEPKLALTMYMKHGLQVYLTKRTPRRSELSNEYSYFHMN